MAEIPTPSVIIPCEELLFKLGTNHEKCKDVVSVGINFLRDCKVIDNMITDLMEDCSVEKLLNDEEFNETLRNVIPVFYNEDEKEKVEKIENPDEKKEALEKLSLESARVTIEKLQTYVDFYYNVKQLPKMETKEGEPIEVVEYFMKNNDEMKELVGHDKKPMVGREFFLAWYDIFGGHKQIFEENYRIIQFLANDYVSSALMLCTINFFYIYRASGDREDEADEFFETLFHKELNPHLFDEDGNPVIEEVE